MNRAPALLAPQGEPAQPMLEGAPEQHNPPPAEASPHHCTHRTCRMMHETVYANTCLTTLTEQNSEYFFPRHLSTLARLTGLSEAGIQAIITNAYRENNTPATIKTQIELKLNEALEQRAGQLKETLGESIPWGQAGEQYERLLVSQEGDIQRAENHQTQLFDEYCQAKREYSTYLTTTQAQAKDTLTLINGAISEMTQAQGSQDDQLVPLIRHLLTTINQADNKQQKNPKNGLLDNDKRNPALTPEQNQALNQKAQAELNDLLDEGRLETVMANVAGNNHSRATLSAQLLRPVAQVEGDVDKALNTHAKPHKRLNFFKKIVFPCLHDLLQETHPDLAQLFLDHTQHLDKQQIGATLYESLMTETCEKFESLDQSTRSELTQITKIQGRTTALVSALKRTEEASSRNGLVLFIGRLTDEAHHYAPPGLIKGVSGGNISGALRKLQNVAQHNNLLPQAIRERISASLNGLLSATERPNDTWVNILKPNTQLHSLQTFHDQRSIPVDTPNQNTDTGYTRPYPMRFSAATFTAEHTVEPGITIEAAADAPTEPVFVTPNPLNDRDADLEVFNHMLEHIEPGHLYNIEIFDSIPMCPGCTNSFVDMFTIIEARGARLNRVILIEGPDKPGKSTKDPRIPLFEAFSDRVARRVAEPRPIDQETEPDS